MFMNYKLEESITIDTFFDFFITLMPFILLLLLFTFNSSLKQKFVTENIFYNCSCIMAFLTILFIEYRALYDKNMIFWTTEGFNINFTYFSDQLAQIKVLVYLMCITNLLLFAKNKLFKKKIELM